MQINRQRQVEITEDSELMAQPEIILMQSVSSNSDHKNVYRVLQAF